MCRRTVTVWHRGCTRMAHFYTSSAHDLLTYSFGKNSDEKKFLFLRTSIMSALKTLLETTIHNVWLMPFKNRCLTTVTSYTATGMLWTVSGPWCKKPVDDYTTWGFKIYYTNKIKTPFTTFIFYSYRLVVDWLVKANLYLHSKTHLRNCPS